MIDPSFAISGADGAEWQIGGLEGPGGAQGSEAGFGKMLGDSIASLQNTQNQAATAAQDLASGKATDPAAVVMAVERAQLSMQLAGQIRTKAVEAANEIFHTSV